MIIGYSNWFDCKLNRPFIIAHHTCLFNCTFVMHYFKTLHCIYWKLPIDSKKQPINISDKLLQHIRVSLKHWFCVACDLKMCVFSAFYVLLELVKEKKSFCGGEFTYLEHESPTPVPWTSTGPWPIVNWAVQAVGKCVNLHLHMRGI